MLPMTAHSRFQTSEKKGQHFDQNKINDGRTDERHEGLIGCAFNEVTGFLNIHEAHIAYNGRFFNQRDERIAHGGKDIGDCLWENDVEHGLGRAETKATSGFRLSFGNRENTGTNNLRTIAAGINAEGDGGDNPFFPIHRREHDEIDDHQLGDGRSAANDVGINSPETIEKFIFGQSADGDKKTDQEA